MNLLRIVMPKLYTQQIGDNTETDQGQTRTNSAASHGRSDYLITMPHPLTYRTSLNSGSRRKAIHKERQRLAYIR